MRGRHSCSVCIRTTTFLLEPHKPIESSTHFCFFFPPIPSVFFASSHSCLPLYSAQSSTGFPLYLQPCSTSPCSPLEHRDHWCSYFSLFSMKFVLQSMFTHDSVFKALHSIASHHSCQTPKLTSSLYLQCFHAVTLASPLPNTQCLNCCTVTLFPLILSISFSVYFPKFKNESNIYI